MPPVAVCILAVAQLAQQSGSAVLRRDGEQVGRAIEGHICGDLRGLEGDDVHFGVLEGDGLGEEVSEGLAGAVDVEIGRRELAGEGGHVDNSRAQRPPGAHDREKPPGKESEGEAIDGDELFDFSILELVELIEEVDADVVDENADVLPLGLADDGFDEVIFGSVGEIGDDYLALGGHEISHGAELLRIAGDENNFEATARKLDGDLLADAV